MKKKIVISCVCIFIVLVLSIGVYWCFHPTHYKFNDRFIIGNSKDNIIEKYGEFDYSKYDESGNYLYAEYVASHYNYPKYTPGLIRKRYIIEFENDIATNVEIREGEYIQ